MLAATLAVSSTGAGEPVFRLHAEVVQAWEAGGIAVEDAAAMFDAVWARLPAEIDVFPTENYVYWQLVVDGRELRGNLRLTPGDREAGTLHFAYSEWQEFPSEDRALRLRREAVHKVLAAGRDAFEWIGTHRGKRVVFCLHHLDQSPPPAAVLRPGETFVMRTADESGLRFLLVFDEAASEFRWLLDEAQPVPEHWRELEPGIVQGRRTGFVFVQEPGRRRLAAVRLQSVLRNDWFDGPFDQLADNFADASPLQRCLEKSDPSLRGRIDSRGRFTDSGKPGRVAIAPYGQYASTVQAIRLARGSKAESPTTPTTVPDE